MCEFYPGEECAWEVSEAMQVRHVGNMPLDMSLDSHDGHVLMVTPPSSKDGGDKVTGSLVSPVFLPSETCKVWKIIYFSRHIILSVHINIV